MTSADRTRLRIAAVAAATLTVAGVFGGATAQAAPAVDAGNASSSSSQVAQSLSDAIEDGDLKETEHGFELAIKPGETIALEPAKDSGVTFVIDEGPESSLPAGWSALTKQTGVRVTAPLSAPDSEFAPVEVRGAGENTAEDEPQELRLVVTREEREDDAQETPGPAQEASTSNSAPSSTAWLGSLVGTLVTLFTA